MISIEVEARDLVCDMARESGAGTIVRKLDGQMRVEVANGARAFTWSFSPIVRNKSRALREIRADMESALRRVGLSAPAATQLPAFTEQIHRFPRGLDGPIGNQIREAIVKRVGKPVEADQPDVSFPHVAIPEKKVPKEISVLRKRIDAIERDMASVKQITDQLR